jgi:hypothetical protein
MFSPMMTVVVLAVLWLIVVVPMILRRSDERAGQRAILRFGGAMRALSTRCSLSSIARPAPDPDAAHGYDRPDLRTSRPQIFVPGGARRTTPASRPPVPAAVEAVMYSDRLDRADMSDARRRMMTRRRRSLTLLTLGCVIALGWALAAGPMLAWIASAVFGVILVGYLSFLRSQARRARERRAVRQQRHMQASRLGYDATAQVSYDAEAETVVRIDDDDVALHGIASTVDLTGLYVEEEFHSAPMRRAV